MTGKSLYPLIQGESEDVYSDDEPVGMEAAGQCALFKGDLKLVKNGKPYGDGIWRMYDVKKDPGETVDLKETLPNKFEEMIHEYFGYTKKFGVLEMGINYET